MENRIADLTQRTSSLEAELHSDVLADRVTRLEITLKEFRTSYDATAASISAKLDRFSETNTVIRLVQPIVVAVVTAVCAGAIMYAMGLSTK